jgi:hypothetical protein
VGGSGPSTDPASGAGGPGRRLRAAVAGAVTFAVVVIGGLLVVADDAPSSVAGPSATSAESNPSPSSTPEPKRLRPPSHFRIERGVTSLRLVWDPPPGGEPGAVAHYEVFRDGKRIGRPTRARYDVTGLTFGTGYRFWIVAVDSDGRASPRVVRSVTTRVPPVADSRLSGTYTTTAALASSVGERVRFFSSHSITWSLVPQCSATACNVSFTATHRFGSDTVVTSGVLDWSGGATYTGRWTGSFGTNCRNKKLRSISAITITMRATGARVVGGLWVASGVGGSIRERVAGCGGAPTASYDF